MPETITCSKAECGATIPARGKEIGETVQCPKCGANNQVLAAFGDDFEIQTFDTSAAASQGKRGVSHPARQQCPNCGAVLGVRDAICRKCNADIRTGAVVQQTVQKKASPLAPVLIGAGVALVVLIVVLAVVLAAG